MGPCEPPFLPLYCPDMRLPISSRFKTKKDHIGILIRDRRVILTKIRHTPTGPQILMVRHYRFSRDLRRVRELDQFLRTLPPSFFRNSTVNLCVPFRQFVTQRVTLPTLSDTDKIAALSQMVDHRQEIWDYETFSAGTNSTHSDIMLHKLKRSSLEAYVKICQKYCDRIQTVTT